MTINVLIAAKVMLITFCKTLRVENANQLITGHLYVNSTRNEFRMLSSIISNNINIIMISETRLDESFPLFRFLVQGFTNLIKFDKARHAGGVPLYMKEAISFKKLEYKAFGRLTLVGQRSMNLSCPSICPSVRPSLNFLKI